MCVGTVKILWTTKMFCTLITIRNHSRQTIAPLVLLMSRFWRIKRQDTIRSIDVDLLDHAHYQRPQDYVTKQWIVSTTVREEKQLNTILLRGVKKQRERERRVDCLRSMRLCSAQSNSRPRIARKHIH